MTKEEFKNLKIGTELVAPIQIIGKNESEKKYLFKPIYCDVKGEFDCVYGDDCCDNWSHQTRIEDLPIVKNLEEKCDDIEAENSSLKGTIANLEDEVEKQERWRKDLLEECDTIKEDNIGKAKIIDNQEKEIEALKAKVRLLNDLVEKFSINQKHLSEDARATEWMQWGLDLAKALKGETTKQDLRL